MITGYKGDEGMDEFSRGDLAALYQKSGRYTKRYVSCHEMRSHATDSVGGRYGDQGFSIGHACARCSEDQESDMSFVLEGLLMFGNNPVEVLDQLKRAVVRMRELAQDSPDEMGAKILAVTSQIATAVEILETEMIAGAPAET